MGKICIICQQEIKGTKERYYTVREGALHEKCFFLARQKSKAAGVKRGRPVETIVS